MTTLAPTLTLVTIAGVLLGLVFTRVQPYLLLVGALALLMTTGIITEVDVLAGAANPGMATVGVLFAVAAGLRETGGFGMVAKHLLGRPAGLGLARLRLIVPVALLSAFMNNTPLVAMMMPVVGEWARTLRVSVSKLLIPLSYASILGGACTLIGTSTTLVVNGLIAEDLGAARSLGMFEIGAVGLPVAAVGVLYLVLFGGVLLPERKPVLERSGDLREYTVELTVEPGSLLVGQSLERAGLRSLPSAYVAEVVRGDRAFAAVSPEFVLEAGDRLLFVGGVDGVVDLRKIRGLLPASSQPDKVAAAPHRRLVEVVISQSSPLVGQSIRMGRFRTRYNAAVIAAARAGERVRGRLGDLVLAPGDTLLLEARPSFFAQHRFSRDFLLVSQLEDSAAPRHERAGAAIAILGLMVLVVAAGWLSMFNAALLAAGAMIAFGCCSSSAALRAIDWHVLLAITAAYGLGRAMDRSGAAAVVADALLGLVRGNAHASLAVLCAVTMLFTNAINANAAAVLVYPIGIRTATELGVDPMPFAIAIIMGATASFATPIGYPTNLMVFGPGGYRFGDYMRAGAPLSLLTWGIATLLIPHFWPF